MSLAIELHERKPLKGDRLHGQRLIYCRCTPKFPNPEVRTIHVEHNDHLDEIDATQEEELRVSARRRSSTKMMPPRNLRWRLTSRDQRNRSADRAGRTRSGQTDR